ncbi:DUF4349 domain-containing protein [Paenibacillus sp. YPG26]|uniref:DUF4349 domain-containing protein n=1 Tax=Paenibacillus sp. YPG26 TaxID=2878915 RepID=UPI00204020C8|nr:DUF4349 domain-containing protein [Paenibacillus sp. YPG26]USB32181.1 DUF4349 domain-containing protein [Paenibacillus sp. YPG26]
MKKRGFICSLVLGLSLVLGACSSAGGSTAKMELSGSSSSDMKNAAQSTAGSAVDTNSVSAIDDAAAAATLTESKQPSSGFANSEIKAGADKKLIYKAELSMRVKDYRKVQTEIREHIAKAGGYIVQFSENQSDQQLGGNFVIKIPAAGFNSFIDGIGKIKHESMDQNIEGQDVTEEYIDLESRLKAKMIMEERYVSFMKKATKTDELVKFAKELGRIQEEIEQAKGRMRFIDNNVSYSTVTLHLYQREGMAGTVDSGKEDTPLGERAKDALAGTLHVLSQLLQWTVVVLSGAFPVLVLGAVLIAIIWSVRKARARRRAEARLALRNDTGRQAQENAELNMNDDSNPNSK